MTFTHTQAGAYTNMSTYLTTLFVRSLYVKTYTSLTLYYIPTQHTHTHKLNAALTHMDTTQFLHTFTCVHVGRDICVHVCTSVPTTHTHVHMYAKTYSYMCVHTNNTHTNTRVHKHNMYTRLHICIQAQKLKNITSIHCRHTRYTQCTGTLLH